MSTRAVTAAQHQPDGEDVAHNASQRSVATTLRLTKRSNQQIVLAKLPPPGRPLKLQARNAQMVQRLQQKLQTKVQRMAESTQARRLEVTRAMRHSEQLPLRQKAEALGSLVKARYEQQQAVHTLEAQIKARPPARHAPIAFIPSDYGLPPEDSPAGQLLRRLQTAFPDAETIAADRRREAAARKAQQQSQYYAQQRRQQMQATEARWRDMFVAPVRTILNAASALTFTVLVPLQMVTIGAVPMLGIAIFRVVVNHPQLPGLMARTKTWSDVNRKRLLMDLFVSITPLMLTTTLMLDLVSLAGFDTLRTTLQAAGAAASQLPILHGLVNDAAYLKTLLWQNSVIQTTLQKTLQTYWPHLYPDQIQKKRLTLEQQYRNNIFKELKQGHRYAEAVLLHNKRKFFSEWRSLAPRVRFRLLRTSLQRSAPTLLCLGLAILGAAGSVIDFPQLFASIPTSWSLGMVGSVTAGQAFKAAIHENGWSWDALAILLTRDTAKEALFATAKTAPELLAANRCLRQISAVIALQTTMHLFNVRGYVEKLVLYYMVNVRGWTGARVQKYFPALYHNVMARKAEEFVSTLLLSGYLRLLLTQYAQASTSHLLGVAGHLMVTGDEQLETMLMDKMARRQEFRTTPEWWAHGWKNGGATGALNALHEHATVTMLGSRAFLADTLGLDELGLTPRQLAQLEGFHGTVARDQLRGLTPDLSDMTNPSGWRAAYDQVEARMRLTEAQDVTNEIDMIISYLQQTQYNGELSQADILETTLIDAGYSSEDIAAIVSTFDEARATQDRLAHDFAEEMLLQPKTTPPETDPVPSLPTSNWQPQQDFMTPGPKQSPAIGTSTWDPTQELVQEFATDQHRQTLHQDRAGDMETLIPLMEQVKKDILQPLHHHMEAHETQLLLKDPQQRADRTMILKTLLETEAQEIIKTFGTAVNPKAGPWAARHQMQMYLKGPYRQQLEAHQTAMFAHMETITLGQLNDVSPEDRRLLHQQLTADFKTLVAQHLENIQAHWRSLDTQGQLLKQDLPKLPLETFHRNPSARVQAILQQYAAQKIEPSVASQTIWSLYQQFGASMEAFVQQTQDAWNVNTAQSTTSQQQPAPTAAAPPDTEPSSTQSPPVTKTTAYGYKTVMQPPQSTPKPKNAEQLAEDEAVRVFQKLNPALSGPDRYVLYLEHCLGGPLSPAAALEAKAEFIGQTAQLLNYQEGVPLASTFAQDEIVFRRISRTIPQSMFEDLLKHEAQLAHKMETDPQFKQRMIKDKVFREQQLFPKKHRAATKAATNARKHRPRTTTTKRQPVLDKTQREEIKTINTLRQGLWKKIAQQERLTTHFSGLQKGLSPQEQKLRIMGANMIQMIRGPGLVHEAARARTLMEFLGFSQAEITAQQHVLTTLGLKTQQDLALATDLITKMTHRFQAKYPGVFDCMTLVGVAAGSHCRSQATVGGIADAFSRLADTVGPNDPVTEANRRDEGHMHKMDLRGGREKDFGNVHRLEVDFDNGDKLVITQEMDEANQRLDVKVKEINSQGKERLLNDTKRFNKVNAADATLYQLDQNAEKILERYQQQNGIGGLARSAHAGVRMTQSGLHGAAYVARRFANNVPIAQFLENGSVLVNGVGQKLQLVKDVHDLINNPAQFGKKTLTKKAARMAATRIKKAAGPTLTKGLGKLTSAANMMQNLQMGVDIGVAGMAWLSHYDTENQWFSAERNAVLRDPDFHVSGFNPHQVLMTSMAMTDSPETLEESLAWIASLEEQVQTSKTGTHVWDAVYGVNNVRLFTSVVASAVKQGDARLASYLLVQGTFGEMASAAALPDIHIKAQAANQWKVASNKAST